MPKHLPYSISLFSLLGCITPGKVADQDNVETTEEPATSDTATGIDTSVEDTETIWFSRTLDTGEEEPIELPNLLQNPSFEDGEDTGIFGAGRVV